MKTCHLFWKWPGVQVGPHADGQPANVYSEVWVEQREGLRNIAEQ